MNVVTQDRELCRCSRIHLLEEVSDWFHNGRFRFEIVGPIEERLGQARFGRSGARAVPRSIIVEALRGIERLVFNVCQLVGALLRLGKEIEFRR